MPADKAHHRRLASVQSHLASGAAAAAATAPAVSPGAAALATTDIERFNATGFLALPAVLSAAQNGRLLSDFVQLEADEVLPTPHTHTLTVPLWIRVPEALSLHGFHWGQRFSHLRISPRRVPASPPRTGWLTF